MARPSKQRRQELKRGRFRDETINFFERLSNLLEGRGRTILYSLLGIVALAALFSTWSWYSHRRADAARLALGRAIEIANTPVSPSPVPGQTTPSFTDEKQRAQKAVEEFEKVAAAHPDPYREQARYFVAVNRLTIDRNRGLSELEALSKNSGNDVVRGWAKFALAQARETDNQLDPAAALYRELVNAKDSSVPTTTLNLRLANVYEKQGKKQEAADLLFNIAKDAREAKDEEGKPVPLSAAAREAAEKLQILDPARYAQLPPEPATNPLAS